MAPGAAAVGRTVARAALAAVFVYAGTLKALAPSDFAWAIYHYRLLPYPAAAALGLYLPWLEIVCGAGVCWPRLRLGALNLLFALCLVFVAALASAWLRHLDIACGCFGGGDRGAHALLFSLGRAIGLTVLSGWLLGVELVRAAPALPPAEMTADLLRGRPY